MANEPDVSPHELSQRFAQLVMMQVQNILYLLGRLPGPHGEAPPPQLQDAKMLIDQLEMILVKTKGNLTAPEAKLLDNALTQTRLAFVEASGGTPASMMPSPSAFGGMDPYGAEEDLPPEEAAPALQAVPAQAPAPASVPDSAPAPKPERPRKRKSSSRATVKPVSESPAPASPSPGPARPSGPEAASPQSRVFYIVLAAFVGPLGIHNFYARRFLPGAIQLAISLPSFWVIGPLWTRINAAVQDALLNGGELDAASLGGSSSLLLWGIGISSLWALLDLFLVKRDGAGRLLR